MSIPPRIKVHKTLSTHVLVIGSGGSGVRAAIEASMHGSCILVSKAVIGKGGCTVMAEGGYNAVLHPDDSIAIHYEDTMRGGGYLNDPALVEALVTDSPKRIADLVDWGATFDVLEDEARQFSKSGSGTSERSEYIPIRQRSFGGQSFPRTCYAGDRTGHEIISTLLARLAATCTVQINELDIIALLHNKDGDRVIGAAGLDIEGRLILISADAVVLATGGGCRIYNISTNSAGGTGDGYALAFRAGCDLIDMEQVQFHPTGAVTPWDARGRLVTEAVRGEGGVLLNTQGERFMERYDPKRMELSTRDQVARAIATEVKEGRGTDNGGVYLNVSHLPAEIIEARLPVMLEQFLLFDIDIRKEPMEVAPTAHHIMGGVRITPHGETTIPGLFACGEVTGGVHGANRLGGNALADTLVFGKRAGERAGMEPKQNTEISEAQVNAFIDHLMEYYTNTEEVSSARDALRVVMWDHVGIFRTREQLLIARKELERLAQVKVHAKTPQELIDCCTFSNMCLVGRLIVESALTREESRGAHTRVDIKTLWSDSESPYGHTVIRAEWDVSIEYKEREAEEREAGSKEAENKAESKAENKNTGGMS
ncbi:MAG: fumarate reductase subunit A [Methanomicrobiales archaeon]|jgi:fumarate reductase (CoM/CoB) subunit A|nr:fumarate reductase subunit A [Methanomicrobiales archaeon]